MKRILTTLFLSLLLMTPCLSQTTSEDTLRKITAIIFVEHEYLTNENSLLKDKIKRLQEVNEICEKTDSVHLEEIKIQNQELTSKDKQIKKLKNTNKTSILGGVLLFIIGLLL